MQLSLRSNHETNGGSSLRILSLTNIRQTTNVGRDSLKPLMNDEKDKATEHCQDAQMILHVNTEGCRRQCNYTFPSSTTGVCALTFFGDVCLYRVDGDG